MLSHDSSEFDKSLHDNRPKFASYRLCSIEREESHYGFLTEGMPWNGIVARTNAIGVANLLTPKQYPLVRYAQQKYFGALSSVVNGWNNVGSAELKPNVTPSILPVTIPARTITKFSMRKGKRKSAKTVLRRFYRLNWGIWIRTRAGRSGFLWKKSQNRKHRLRQHVFCNSTQSTMLDKMVTNYWKRPHYYVDDPYNPYHSREEFPITRKKPLP